jgi:hypothetical protein
VQFFLDAFPQLYLYPTQMYTVIGAGIQELTNPLLKDAQLLTGLAITMPRAGTIRSFSVTYTVLNAAYGDLVDPTLTLSLYIAPPNSSVFVQMGPSLTLNFLPPPPLPLVQSATQSVSIPLVLGSQIMVVAILAVQSGTGGYGTVFLNGSLAIA